jgi:potassium-transporting ATPase KdpC subunit
MRMHMKEHLRPAIVLFVLLTVITGAAYPALVTLVAQLVFPSAANGSLIMKDGKAVGSELIGQPFDDPRYFWGRPSATSPAYNGASSTGSNLGPTNPAQFDAVKRRLEAIRKEHPSGDVPVELVVASGSGLDPHISPKAAEFQIPRVAKARGMTESGVRRLIDGNTESRTFGVLGEPRVNVLNLNLGLDRAARTP